MAGWVGVAMIVSGGILFSVSKAFPGYAALWPISGAALVLWAGNTPAARAQGSATRLLGTRLLVYLGGVSYGIYLWHWPLLTFYRYRFGQGAIPLLPGLCIMLAAIALAIVSTRLLERPVRTALANRLRPWPLIAVAAIAIAALAVPAAALWRLTPAPAASYGTTFVASADHPRAASPLGGATPVRAARLTPDLASVASESPMPEGCSQDGTDPAIVECQFGNPEGETVESRVVVYDGHRVIGFD